MTAGALYKGTAIEMLAGLGATDAAFAMADAFYSATPLSTRDLDTEVLFRQTTAAMRKDARFMPLMRRLGLAALWRKRGKMARLLRRTRPAL